MIDAAKQEASFDEKICCFFSPLWCISWYSGVQNDIQSRNIDPPDWW
jgi:hypothetical protein